MMSETMLFNLRSLVKDLGKNGGLMSPSIYDTAQVLRYWPDTRAIKPTLNWLIEQQREDGGWGDPATPITRDVPTLAAILALHKYQTEINEYANIINRAVQFLNQQSVLWLDGLSEELPVGVELILPKLLEEAWQADINLPYHQYEVLIPLTNRKRRQIARLNPKAGTPAVYSWEAWGSDPDPQLLDAIGSVGHSPTATAYWLYLAAARPEMERYRAMAQQYLEDASYSTMTKIPELMPTAWPINRYEQAFVLHTLLIADLLDHPALQDVIEPQLCDLAKALKTTGIGFSDHFVADGDDTAAAIATLKGADYDVSPQGLKQFAVETHFFGYPGELQASHSLTARAIHAMVLFGEDVSKAQEYLIEHQMSDGRWLSDKWHTSWIYGTLLASFALKQSGVQYEAALQSAIDAIQSRQNEDGGWGIAGESTSIDTAYGALTLFILRDCENADFIALHRAYQWLVDNYRPFHFHQEKIWLNKQQYAPYRIDWAFELIAIFALSEVVVGEIAF